MNDHTTPTEPVDERTYQAVVRAAVASADDLDPAHLGQLQRTVSGPLSQRWQSEAAAATAALATRLDMPAGAERTTPAPVPPRADLEDQLNHLRRIWSSHGAVGVRQAVAALDSYLAKALTLGLIVLNVRTRRPRFDDADFEAWSEQVIGHAHQLHHQSLHPPAWLMLLAAVLSAATTLAPWALLFVPAAAVYLLAPGPGVARAGWALGTLILTFILGNLASAAHRARKARS